MKRTIIISCFLFLLLSKVAIGQTIKNELKITPIAPDLYVYSTYKMFGTKKQDANAMYAITTDGVVLFDSPWDDFSYQNLLDSIASKHHKKVIMAIATHAHEDRTSGFDFYKKKGIKTYSTKLTDKISIKKKQPRAQFLISKDTVFTVGDKTFETYYAGPGHTKDNIVVWFNDQKLLYSGCLVKSIDATDLEYVGEAKIAQWPKTIKKVQAKFKDPKYIVTGHHDWTSTKALDHTLYLLEANKKKNKSNK